MSLREKLFDAQPHLSKYLAHTLWHTVDALQRFESYLGAAFVGCGPSVGNDSGISLERGKEGRQLSLR